MLWPLTLAILIVLVVCLLLYLFRRDIAYLFGRTERHVDSSLEEIAQAHKDGLEKD